jgi:hypothetical protein
VEAPFSQKMTIFLLASVERICMGLDDHKQEIFNLVQALKTLFWYLQSKMESVKEYLQNFKSHWDMVEAFRGYPGIHKGLVDVF